MAPSHAAVTAAHDWGQIGLSPAGMRAEVQRCKRQTAKPFGVDLLLPAIGGSARKTNKDYTGGQVRETLSPIPTLLVSWKPN
eukprot:COSAG01_NODE_3597_length_5894_cov_1.898188_3_plen_82_part_00